MKNIHTSVMGPFQGQVGVMLSTALHQTSYSSEKFKGDLLGIRDI